MRCLCFHKDLRPEHIRCYVVESDGTAWIVYAPCPVHGHEAIEAAFVPHLTQTEPPAVVAATVQTGA